MTVRKPRSMRRLTMKSEIASTAESVAYQLDSGLCCYAPANGECALHDLQWSSCALFGRNQYA
jgi:hypothetical protein